MANKKTRPSIWKLIRNRILAGLFVVFPLYITFVVIRWIYEALVQHVIGAISRQLILHWFPNQTDLPFVIQNVAGPAAAFVLVGSLLFIAGMFFNSRIHKFVDWFLDNVPGVNLVYSVVSNVFEAVQRSQFGTGQFKRVVLVEFPHPGMKAPAFVTAETVDEKTGETILCVYVPTTPIPTSGYMLLVPEANATALDWNLQDTLQAIVSGGITAPDRVRYYEVATAAPKIIEKPTKKN